MNVYDTSSDRPLPSELQPGDGVIVYSSNNPGKVPSASECTAYRAHGVNVGFVFEDQSGRAIGGTFAEGWADGDLSLAMAKARGHKQGKPHYVACDQGSTISLDYARGFQAGLTAYYLPGLYAGDRNLELVRTRLGWSKLWQAGASSWSDHWDSDRHHGNYTYANLWQSVLASQVPGTDLNVINLANPDWNGTDMLNATDPVIIGINIKLNNLDTRLTDVARTIVHGDADHPNSEDAISAHLNALAATVARLTDVQDAGAVVTALLAAGLPEQLAQDLASHLQLSTK